MLLDNSSAMISAWPDKKLRPGKIFLILLIFCQPCLDILSFALAVHGYGNAVSTLLRGSIMLLLVGGGLYFAPDRRYRLVALCIDIGCVVFWLVHFWIGRLSGITAVTADLANYLKLAQLPVATVCLINLFGGERRVLRRIFWRCAAGVFGLICLLDLIALLSGSFCYTYVDLHHGLLGWYQNANAQSNILAVLYPLTLYALFRAADDALASNCCGGKLQQLLCRPSCFALCFGAVTLAGGLRLFFFGTRVTFYSLPATAAAMLLSLLGYYFYLRTRAKVARRGGVGEEDFGGATTMTSGETITARWPGINLLKIVVICPILVAILAFAFKSYSPMQQMREQDFAIASSAAQNMIKKLPRLDGKKHEYSLEDLRPLYEFYMPSIVKEFGLREVVTAYNSSTDFTVLRNVRTQKIHFAALRLAQSPAALRWTGLNFATMSVPWEVGSYDLESDAQALYYYNGYIGVTLFLLGLLCLVIMLGKHIRRVGSRKFWQNHEILIAGYGVALLLAAALVGGSVLRRPSVSIYLAALLAIAWCDLVESYSAAGGGCRLSD